MKEYLTDEELELLIEQMEQQELYAPGYMKEQILSKAFPKQTAPAVPGLGGRKGRGQIQTFSYRLKIIAGMAAALLMLFLLPMQGEIGEYPVTETESRLEDAGDEETGEEPDLNRVLNGSMRRTGERLNAWIGRMDHIQLDSLFE